MSSFNVFTATKIVEYHFSSKYVDDVGCGLRLYMAAK